MCTYLNIIDTLYIINVRITAVGMSGSVILDLLREIQRFCLK